MTGWADAAHLHTEWRRSPPPPWARLKLPTLSDAWPSAWDASQQGNARGRPHHLTPGTGDVSLTLPPEAHGTPDRSGVSPRQVWRNLFLASTHESAPGSSTAHSLSPVLEAGCGRTASSTASNSSGSIGHALDIDARRASSPGCFAPTVPPAAALYLLLRKTQINSLSSQTKDLLNFC